MDPSTDANTEGSNGLFCQHTVALSLFTQEKKYHRLLNKRYRVRSWETAFHLPRPIGSARQLRAVEVSCAAGAKDVVKLSIYGLLTSARPQAPDMRPYPNRAIMKWQVQIPLEYFVRRTSVRFWCTLESSPLGGTGWFAGLACIRTYRGPHGSVCFRN